jgi:hypothetical protein
MAEDQEAAWRRAAIGRLRSTLEREDRAIFEDLVSAADEDPAHDLNGWLRLVAQGKADWPEKVRRALILELSRTGSGCFCLCTRCHVAHPGTGGQGASCVCCGHSNLTGLA